MRVRIAQASVLVVVAASASLLTPLTVSSAAPEEARGKPSPSVAANDPRSSGALNRDAAKAAQAAGLVQKSAGGSSNMILQRTVNDPSADASAQDTQSETSLAAVGTRVIAAWNDSGSFTGGNNHFTGYGVSSNTGLSFTDKGTLPASGEGDAGDPVVAANQITGAVYLSTLGFTTGENIQVFKSTDFGQTFGAPVNATPGYAGSGDFQDKEWMTVDSTPGPGQSNVYLCWTRFGAATEIRFTRSTDHGATFGPNLGTLISSGGQGCFVVVAPNHVVHVFYYRGTGAGGNGGDNKLFTRKSIDQGVSFGPEVQVADLLTTTINGNLGLVGGERSNSFPHAAVNPANGDLYAVFNDNPAGADNSDVYYTRSTTGGATWNPPVQFNNDDASREQFFPTVQASTNGTSMMFGYYSKVNDSAQILFHRRGRMATVNAGTGALTFQPSFVLSPDSPVVIGQDPVINTTYMGDYDQIAATPGFFHTTWADHRNGNSFHTYQPDVRYARINATPANTNPAVALTAPANANVGDLIPVRATVTNGGANRAEDVFVTVTLPAGLVPKNVTATGGTCHTVGQLAECSVGGVPVGGSRIVDITAFASSSGAKTSSVAITTSSADANTANNTATATTTVSGAGVAAVYSTGNIAVPIPDLTTTVIPIDVPDDGAILSLSARVRLNHTFDADLDIFLISPADTVVELSSNNGGGGDNYGSGANSCAGTPTTFHDAAATSIAAGAAPFAGIFRPEQPLSNFSNENPQGGWRLRIVDEVGGDFGTVGCVSMTITRKP